jgi:hypothetical protein
MARHSSDVQWFGSVCADPDSCKGDRPRKKPRGNRRYYRALEREALTFAPDVAGWFNLSHWHTDWRGRGNRSWRGRQAHLTALFTRFERLLQALSQRPEPAQCWLLIDANDSANDALYLHTPNPHSAYPVEVRDVDWDAPVPIRLQPFMRDGWLFGRSDVGGTRFFIRPH